MGTGVSASVATIPRSERFIITKYVLYYVTMSDEIVLSEIRETNWGEEAVLQSPFEAKDFIKVLPWKRCDEELQEYGSLREAAKGGPGEINDAALEAVEAYQKSHGFSDDFSTHSEWKDDLDAWVIDVDAFDEARHFWEYCGFDVSVSPHIDEDVL